MLSRSQALNLVFLGLAWLSLVVILIVAPDIYDQALQLPAGNNRLVDIGFLAGLTVFIGLIAFTTFKRWRWAFWLLLVANLFGVLRVPAAALQLAGVLQQSTPTWYVVFQAVIGGVQLMIGLVMLADYRRAGVWGTRAAWNRPAPDGVARASDT